MVFTSLIFFPYMRNDAVPVVDTIMLPVIFDTPPLRSMVEVKFFIVKV